MCLGGGGGGIPPRLGQRGPLGLARGDAGGVQFFMIKPTNIRDKNITIQIE